MRALLTMAAAITALCLAAGTAQADAPLTSHWQFDEASGATTVDAVTGAAGTLTGGAAFGAGKSGNGLVLTGGTATGPLTTDTGQSFSVSAWVNLSAPCTSSCNLVAVSGDGVRSSRFTLGYVRDRDHLGNWRFAVAEADTDRAPVTSAAVSAVPEEAGQWTHLVGVYDAQEQRVSLYVNGSLVGEGTALNQWSGAGGFTVGAARKAGALTGFFPGTVDEVRFHGDVLTGDEAFALYLSPGVTLGSRS